MGQKTVSEGATLECSLGTETSELQVPIFHGVSGQNKNQANITDSKPIFNILPFCMCKRVDPPVPCIPVVIMKWLNGQPDCVLDYELALLEKCIVPCCQGGIIRIKKCGQDF